MMSKKNLFPIITLTVIGVAVALLLAAVNAITAPAVAERERLAILESLQIVMPGGDFGDEIVSDEIPEDAPDTVQAIYTEKTGMGKVVVLNVQGYASVISMTVGIDSAGKVTSAVVTSEQESHGQAGMKDFPNSFAGLDVGGVAGAPLYTQATVTSGAMRDAVLDAMYAIGYYVDRTPTQVTLPKTDEQIKAIAESYVGGEVEEITLGEDAPSTLKRLYYHAPSGSYIAYNITSTKYVPVETEGFVVIDKNGVIVDVDMLTWTVGHGVNPPENYVETFIGRDKNSIVSSELVTEATGSSTNFAAAIEGALIYCGAQSYWQSAIGIAMLCVCVAGVAAYIVAYKIRRRRR